MFKTSVIIPTYNRPKELLDCVQSILKQTIKPYEVIIVDDGNLLELPLKEKCEASGLKYVYIKKNKPGLTESRNVGIRSAGGEIIFFLDDDVVLFSNFIENILKVYQNDQKGIIGGVGGVIANHKPLTLPYRIKRIFDIVFLLSGFKEGKVLPSGFCTDFGTTGFSIKKMKEVDFLSGGVCSFRKKIFQEYSFDSDKYLNYGLGEDKDFSYQVSKKHKLIINPEAQLLHLESPKMRQDKQNKGRMFVIDKYIFFKQHVKKGWWSWIFFYYALLGYVLRRVFIMFVSFDKENVNQVKGIISAIKDILSGKVKTVGI